MEPQIDRVTEKIREFHPEIQTNNMDLSISFDKPAHRYVIKLSKSGESVGAYLDQKDADDCLEGKKCVNLAVLVTQLITELEDLLTPRQPG